MESGPPFGCDAPGIGGGFRFHARDSSPAGGAGDSPAAGGKGLDRYHGRRHGGAQERVPGFSAAGASGGRLDHTLANFSVLLYLVEQGAQAMLADEQNRARMYRPGTFTLDPEEGYRFSLFPFGGEVTGLSETDAYYPLEDAVLRPDSSLGISNEFIRDPVKKTLLAPRISFKTGNLLIFLSKD